MKRQFDFNIPAWIDDDSHSFRKIPNPFRKMSAIKAMLKKLYRRRTDQENGLRNLKAERDAQHKLSAAARKQRIALNELDGFPTAALDSEAHSYKK